MDGLLLADKSSGWTSHDVVGYVRKTLGIKRVGHTGTLDPDATGLLLILVGKATRLAKYHERDAKRYTATMKLGAETDTEDAWGSVLGECDVPVLDDADVEAVFARFIGDIEQLPPMYSAVKVGGRPLYKSARRGEVVERKPRRVTIHHLKLSALDRDTVTFEVVCSKGTYIRTLCSGMGSALGSCAHMSALRRTGAGDYDVEGAVDIGARPDRDALEAAIIPIDRMLTHLPAVVLGEFAAGRVSDGVRPGRGDILRILGDAAVGEPVRVTDESGRLLAVGKYSGEDAQAVLLETVIPA